MTTLASQVFYVSDPSNDELSLVVHMKSRNIGDEEDEDICSILPLTKGLPPIDEEIDNYKDDDVSHLLL